MSIVITRYCKYTYIYVYIHTHIYAYIPENIYIYAYRHIYKHIYTHTYFFMELATWLLGSKWVVPSELITA